MEPTKMVDSAHAPGEVPDRSWYEMDETRALQEHERNVAASTEAMSHLVGKGETSGKRKAVSPSSETLSAVLVVLVLCIQVAEHLAPPPPPAPPLHCQHRSSIMMDHLISLHLVQ